MLVLRKTIQIICLLPVPDDLWLESSTVCSVFDFYI
jgi:hypothetical protein